MTVRARKRLGHGGFPLTVTANETLSICLPYPLPLAIPLCLFPEPSGVPGEHALHPQNPQSLPLPCQLPVHAIHDELLEERWQTLCRDLAGTRAMGSRREMASPLKPPVASDTILVGNHNTPWLFS